MLLMGDMCTQTKKRFEVFENNDKCTHFSLQSIYLVPKLIQNIHLFEYFKLLGESILIIIPLECTHTIAYKFDEKYFGVVKKRGTILIGNN